MKWWLWLLLLLALVPIAHAQDPWRTDIDRVNGQAAQVDYRMPVEACYVNQSLQPDPRYRLVTIWNRMEDGLVIRYIRSFKGYGGQAAGAVRTHDGPFVYIMDARASGEPILRGALTSVPGVRGDRRVSVLRPGERCTMWLPIPQYDGWMVVVERVQVASGGTFVDTLRHCMGTASGRPVECTLRLDTVTYLSTSLKPYGERIVDGTGRYDFTHNTHWTSTPP